MTDLKAIRERAERREGLLDCHNSNHCACYNLARVAREDIPMLCDELAEARQEAAAWEKYAADQTAALTDASNERDESNRQLAAVVEVAESLSPLDWEPYDDWGDYSDLPPNKDGYCSSTDSTNSGDVHRHGYVVGEQAVRKRLTAVLADIPAAAQEKCKKCGREMKSHRLNGSYADCDEMARAEEYVARLARSSDEGARAKLERAEKLAEALEDEEEAVNSSIWNLEQCTSEDYHCNDVTRVHSRLLERREALAAVLREWEVE